MTNIKIIKEKNYEQFYIQIVADESDSKKEFTVILSANNIKLESYNCEDYDSAKLTYNTICATVKSVLALINKT